MTAIIEYCADKVGGIAEGIANKAYNADNLLVEITDTLNEGVARGIARGIAGGIADNTFKVLDFARDASSRKDILIHLSDRGGRFDYPANFRGRVPLKVKVAKNVTPDLMEFKKELGIKDDTICLKDNEYYVWVNSYGAVSAILPNGERLGLLPSEFDVTEWHP